MTAGTSASQLRKYGTMKLPHTGYVQIRFFGDLPFRAKIHNGAKRDRLQQLDIRFGQLPQRAAAKQASAAHSAAVCGF